METLTSELGKETARPRVAGAARIDAEKQCVGDEEEEVDALDP